MNQVAVRLVGQGSRGILLTWAFYLQKNKKKNITDFSDAHACMSLDIGEP